MHNVLSFTYFTSDNWMLMKMVCLGADLENGIVMRLIILDTFPALDPFKIYLFLPFFGSLRMANKKL